MAGNEYRVDISNPHPNYAKPELSPVVQLESNFSIAKKTITNL
jgi:hypothetical protein